MLPPQEYENTASLSVVIPVKDRPDDLVATVATVLSQSLIPAELIIVDQSQSDSCVKAVESLLAAYGGHCKPRLIHVHDPEIDGLIAARDVGFRCSTAAFVVFLDDDVELDNDVFLLLTRALCEHPHLVAVGGIITNYKPPKATARLFRELFYRGFFRDERQPIYWNWFTYSRGQVVGTKKLNGGCMAIRREALVGMGGFDLRYRGASVGEDIDISQRLVRYAGRADVLAIVGGACLVHQSRGQWKREARALEFQIVSAHYLYRRHLSNHPLTTARFLWMISGIVLMALFAAIRRRTLGPLQSVAAAISCIQSGYRGCPFLKPEVQEPEMEIQDC